MDQTNVATGEAGQTLTAPIAVLTSGGLDSAILVAELAQRQHAVHPIYIRSGLAWEAVELAYLRRFLAELRLAAVQPLVVLEMPVRDLYGEHWSLTGINVPDDATPDEAVFLPGRNLLLLLKAMLWCHRAGVPALALGVLKGNPFPDATPSFFADFEQVVNAGIGSRIRVERPYARMHKVEVLKRGLGLPLEWTFSCIRPVEGQHCGACNKCAERQKAFADAATPDPTPYINDQ
jgi:7-cyano-7-deazaguanine synthase